MKWKYLSPKMDFIIADGFGSPLASSEVDTPDYPDGTTIEDVVGDGDLEDLFG